MAFATVTKLFWFWLILMFTCSVAWTIGSVNITWLHWKTRGRITCFHVPCVAVVLTKDTAKSDDASFGMLLIIIRQWHHIYHSDMLRWLTFSTSERCEIRHVGNNNFNILCLITVALLKLLFCFVQANVICVVYSVEDLTSVEKVFHFRELVVMFILEQY